jgi:hypothetical protein
MARSVGLPTAAQILATRPRRETRWPGPSLCGGSVDSRAVFPRAKFFFETRPGTVHVLCKHFRGSTNQHAIPNRRTSAKEKEIPLMWGTTIWRTTASCETPQGHPPSPPRRGSTRHSNSHEILPKFVSMCLKVVDSRRASTIVPPDSFTCGWSATLCSSKAKPFPSKSSSC